MESKVAVVRCLDYDEGTVAAALDEIIAHLGGCKERVVGRTVLVKPNMMGAYAPDSAIVTRPELVEQLVMKLMKWGADVSIGDSPAGVMDSRALAEVWEQSGYDGVVKRTGARKAVFEQAVTARDVIACELDKHYIARAVLTADMVINVPKLKTHRLMKYTGAIKNLMGIVPGSRKAHIHRCGPAPTQVAAVLCDLLAIVRPYLTIMDAVDTIEGDGPAAGGSKRHLGLILGGFDSVAVDCVACDIVGMDPLSVETTRIAVERGLGRSCVRVVGLDLEEIRVVNFQMAGLGKWDTASRFVQRFWELSRTGVQVIVERCTGCGACRDGCPVGAIDLDEVARVREGDCIECYCCHEFCPQHAIDIYRKYEKL